MTIEEAINNVIKNDNAKAYASILITEGFLSKLMTAAKGGASKIKSAANLTGRGLRLWFDNAVAHHAVLQLVWA